MSYRAARANIKARAKTKTRPMATRKTDTLVDVRSQSVRIGEVHPVRDASLHLRRGECRALVGESGCGKSVTAMSLLGLLPPAATVDAERRLFDGEPLPALGSKAWRQLRGNRIAMIFQNPMTALDPTQQIGQQIAEPLREHKGMGRREAKHRAISLLERLAIPQAEQRARQYPFEFSGGMLQRAMIAMAIACEPQLLIADEPTTALDVTVQTEVLALLRELQREQGTALLFITHDLGVVANIADSVSVMYGGHTVESGSVEAIFTDTAHPYTQALRSAVPSLQSQRVLRPIAGTPPDLRGEIRGCPFAARCDRRMAICDEMPPHLAGVAQQQDSTGQHPGGEDRHLTRCWLQHPDHPGPGYIRRPSPVATGTAAEEQEGS